MASLEGAALQTQKQEQRSTTSLSMAEVPESMGSGSAPTAPVSNAVVPMASGGVMVSGAKAMRDQLEGKKLLHGAAKIRRMLPRGAFVCEKVSSLTSK